jgi:hypothetical protein
MSNANAKTKSSELLSSAVRAEIDQWVATRSSRR